MDIADVVLKFTGECGSVFSKFAALLAILVGFSLEIAAFVTFKDFSGTFPNCCGIEDENDNGFLENVCFTGIGFSTFHLVFSLIFIGLREIKDKSSASVIIVCLKLISAAGSATMLLVIMTYNTLVFTKRKGNSHAVHVAVADACVGILFLLITIILDFSFLFTNCCVGCCIVVCSFISAGVIIAQLVIASMIIAGKWDPLEALCFYSDVIGVDIEDYDHFLTCSYDKCLSYNFTNGVVDTSNTYGTVTEYCQANGTSCCYWQLQL